MNMDSLVLEFNLFDYPAQPSWWIVWLCCSQSLEEWLARSWGSCEEETLKGRVDKISLGFSSMDTLVPKQCSGGTRWIYGQRPRNALQQLLPASPTSSHFPGLRMTLSCHYLHPYLLAFSGKPFHLPASQAGCANEWTPPSHVHPTPKEHLSPNVRGEWV